MPAREPGGMVTVKPLSTRGRPGLYRIFTPLNSTYAPPPLVHSHMQDRYTPKMSKALQLRTLLFTRQVAVLTPTHECAQDMQLQRLLHHTWRQESLACAAAGLFPHRRKVNITWNRNNDNERLRARLVTLDCMCTSPGMRTRGKDREGGLGRDETR